MLCFLGGIRLIRLQSENVPRKTSGISLFNSLNKSFDQSTSNKYYSTILSSIWKSPEGILNKYTSIGPAK